MKKANTVILYFCTPDGRLKSREEIRERWINLQSGMKGSQEKRLRKELMKK